MYKLNKKWVKKQKPRKPKRKDTKVPQPSGPTDNVADESVYEEMDGSLERASTTATSLDAEQDRGNINKTQSKATLNKPSSLGTSSASLGDQEDASKQGRKVDNIDKDAKITLVDETQGRYGDDLMFDINDLAGEEVFVAEQGVPNSKKDDVVSTAGVATTVSAAATTIPITPEEITLAQALEELKTAKPKVKGIVFKEPMEYTTTTVSSQQPSQVKVQEKGKVKLVEPKEPMKKKELVRLDEEIASKLQAEFDEEVRLARKRAEKEEEANIVSWDNQERNTLHETRAEGSSKRAGEELKHENAKKQKVDEDREIAKLKRLMKVMPDKEEVALDAIPLVVKSPSIVDWKIHKEGKKSYYQIIRADGCSKMYLVFSHMLKIFDKEVLETFYKLVKAKYGSTRPVEDLDLVLYGDLKTMFEPHVEDNVWKNQSDYRVEKRYSLTAPTITDMLNRKLQADHWNEMCYQLLKLLTKQLKNQ
ncbi:hypothetical protein Tco_1230020 [Tanacetum coccineum]